MVVSLTRLRSMGALQMFKTKLAFWRAGVHCRARFPGSPGRLWPFLPQKFAPNSLRPGPRLQAMDARRANRKCFLVFVCLKEA